MSDDIVARLRGAREYGVTPWPIFAEAADHIEALRELLLDCETERDMYRAADGILTTGSNDE